MPSASLHTITKFHNHFGPDGNDGDALTHLRKAGYVYPRGYISPPKGHIETPKDAAAIDYLCEEWDYAFKENI